jgi:predicted transcriptional regulator
MRSTISDEDWHKLYPIFGFLYGRSAVASRKRQLQVFEHDSNLEFILQVTAELNFHHHYSPDKLIDLLENGVSFDDVLQVKQVPVSALSVAAIINIPRETARRRLKKLEEMGLLHRTPKGYMVTQKTIEYYYTEVRKIYEDFSITAAAIHILKANLGIR